jgi:hypothetical protein
MTDTTRSQRTDHATHDLHVLAAAADRSVDVATRIAAERQAADCRDCAALFADLRSISAGLADLPRELAVTRDFRISPERAAQLRPAGWRGLLQGLLGSGPSLRPFAGALTALGIAGLLLTVGLPGLVGGLGSAAGAAAPAQHEFTSASQPSAAAAPGAGVTDSSKGNDLATSPTRVQLGPVASTLLLQGVAGSPSSAYYGTSQSTGTDRLDSATPSPEAPASVPSVPGVLAAVSLGVLLLGLFLLVRSRARPFDSAG